MQIPKISALESRGSLESTEAQFDRAVLIPAGTLLATALLGLSLIQHIDNKSVLPFSETGIQFIRLVGSLSLSAILVECTRVALLRAFNTSEGGKLGRVLEGGYQMVMILLSAVFAIFRFVSDLILLSGGIALLTIIFVTWLKPTDKIEWAMAILASSSGCVLLLAALAPAFIVLGPVSTAIIVLLWSAAAGIALYYERYVADSKST